MIPPEIVGTCGPTKAQVAAKAARHRSNTFGKIDEAFVGQISIIYLSLSKSWLLWMMLRWMSGSHVSGFQKLQYVVFFDGLDGTNLTQQRNQMIN